MPNLTPPVRTTADAIAYRERVMAALPKGSTFKPLLTCYLTDDTDPNDVERGFRDGVFTGVKLYPANATTYSAAGVTDYNKIKPVLARMEKLGMRFLMHGEDVDPAVDIFDREARFCEKYLGPWTREFPGLKFILEHLSSKDGVDFVRAHAPQVGGTITPYHMELTRTDWLGWGLKPYMYVMPVIKTEKDRQALRKAATSRRSVLFPRHRLRAASGRQEAFDQRHPRHFQRAGGACRLCQGVRGGRRARQTRSVRVAQRPEALWPAAERRDDHAGEAPVDGAGGNQVPGPDERALIHHGGETMAWQVVA